MIFFKFQFRGLRAKGWGAENQVVRAGGRRNQKLVVLREFMQSVRFRM